ncbi:Myosin type-2 heavy chain 1, partial [Cladochytrium tenue]
MEPAVFKGVKSRFQQKYIYTYSGIVLIAMNPFEKLDLYSTDIMREYAGKRRDELEPHVPTLQFGIAEEAYRAMLAGTNQSIIVSGESGAGKTQSTKYIMRYFATVDALSKIDETEALMRPDAVDSALEGGKSDIERAVLATNPILEQAMVCYRAQVDSELKCADREIFRLCAALLHIGNIKVSSGANDDSSSIVDSDPSLVLACKLLEIDKNDFVKWTTKRQITTRGEKFTKELTKDQAITHRDSAAKFILKRDLKDAEHFIGVLDIYGFEHFAVNSFEQFCINYANEKLQQEFNAHVFRLEQELYMREKIAWKMIPFNDNQACIDLIEGKLGIMDLLDEETRFPSGSDSGFLQKINGRFAGPPPHRFYEKPRFSQKDFTVKHYAVDVTYTVDGFLEKNRDTVSLEQYEVLQKSSSELLREIIRLEDSDPLAVAAAAASAAPSSGGSGPLGRKATMSKKPTLGSLFKQSLIQLMETIRLTESHSTFWNQPPRELAEVIVKEVITDPDKYQFGLTFVFLRAGQIAIFEHKRTERTTYLMVLGQKNIKRFIQRRRYLRMRAAAIKIQAAFRANRIKRAKTLAVETKAAIKIQAVWRGYRVRKEYKRTLKCIVWMQSCIRRRLARRQLLALKAEAKSVGHLRELNYTLETKVIEVSRQLHERTDELRAIQDRLASLEANVAAWKERANKAEAQLKTKDEEVTLLSKDVASLKETNATLARERDSVVAKQRGKDRVGSIGPGVEGGVPMTKRTPSAASSIDGRRGRALGARRGSAASANDVGLTDKPLSETPEMATSRLSSSQPGSLTLDIPKQPTLGLGMQRVASPHRSESHGPTSKEALDAQAALIASLRTENATLRRLLATQSSVPAPSSPAPSDGTVHVHFAPAPGITESPRLEPAVAPHPPSASAAARRSLRKTGSIYDGDLMADAERARVKELERARELYLRVHGSDGGRLAAVGPDAGVGMQRVLSASSSASASMRASSSGLRNAPIVPPVIEPRTTSAIPSNSA